MYFPIFCSYFITSLEEAIYISSTNINEKNNDIELQEV